MAVTKGIRIVGLLVACVAVVSLAVQARAQRPATQADRLLGQALSLEEVDGKFQDAIAAYQRVIKAADATRQQKARAQLRIGACYERLGQAEAQRAYEAVVKNYSDQSEFANQAKARLSALTGTATKQTAPAPIRMLWEYDELPDVMALSPLGDSVAAMGQVGDKYYEYDLWLRDVATGVKRTLVSGVQDGSVSYPELAWAPDGRRIAYVWEFDRLTDGSSDGTELRIVDVTNGQIRSVPNTRRAQGTNFFSLKDWSPDGTRILADMPRPPAARSEPQGMAWLSVADGTVQPAGTPAVRWSNARVSPDGRLIAYTGTEGNTVEAAYDIFVAMASGESPVAVVSGGGSKRLVDWTPRGDILFQGTRDGRTGLWLQTMTGPKPDGVPKLVREVDGVRYLSASKNGRVLYATSPFVRPSLFMSTLSTSGEWSAGVRTAAANILSGLSWSPDGQSLLYGTKDTPSPDGGRRGLAVSVDGGRTVRLISTNFNPPGGGWGGPTWTADSRQVFIAGSLDVGGFRKAFFRVDIQSGRTELMTTPIDSTPGGDTNIFIAMSADGRTYYRQVNHNVDKTRHVSFWAHDVQTGAETLLFRTSQPATALVGPLSRDGRWLPVAGTGFGAPVGAGERSIMLLSVAGGPPKTLCVVPASANVSWSAGDRSVIVRSFNSRPGPAGATEKSETRFSECSVDGGPARELGISIPDANVSAVAAHPDGRRLAYLTRSRFLRVNEVWLFESPLLKK